MPVRRELDASLLQDRFAELVAQGAAPIDAIQKLRPKLRRSSAAKQAHDWIKNPRVQRYIAKMNEQVKSRAILTVTECREMLTRIARGEETATAVCFGETFSVGPSMENKLKALDMLLRAGGAYLEPEAPNAMRYIILVPGKSKNPDDWAKEVEAEVIEQAKLNPPKDAG